jgi:hypothetical protein
MVVARTVPTDPSQERVTGDKKVDVRSNCLEKNPYVEVERTQKTVHRVDSDKTIGTMMDLRGTLLVVSFCQSSRYLSPLQ